MPHTASIFACKFNSLDYPDKKTYRKSSLFMSCDGKRRKTFIYRTHQKFKAVQTPLLRTAFAVPTFEQIWCATVHIHRRYERGQCEDFKYSKFCRSFGVLMFEIETMLVHTRQPHQNHPRHRFHHRWWRKLQWMRNTFCRKHQHQSLSTIQNKRRNNF